MAVKGLDLELTDTLKRWLAEKGYDPQLGARPLRRTIQRELEDVLSERLLTGEFHSGPAHRRRRLGRGRLRPSTSVRSTRRSMPDTPPVELAGRWRW
jgi:ATP-dependent Clp protease ATP-binding subunit ClpC